MARASNEASLIHNSLQAIYMRHTDRHGVAHRPYGNDLVDFQRYMGRLLVLRGVMPEGQPYRFSEDPWVIYRREYAPVSSRSRDPYPSTANVPRGILQPFGTGNSRAMFQPRRSSPAPRASMSATRRPTSTMPGLSTGYAAPVYPRASGCHVRFASDLPTRHHDGNGSGRSGRSGHSGPIPRWVN